VVLSAIHQLNPKWVTDEAAFAEVMGRSDLAELLQRDLGDLFAGKSTDTEQARRRVADELSTSIAVQSDASGLAGQLPSEEDRKQFVEAWYGIRV
jgi:hypothetical protein